MDATYYQQQFFLSIALFCAFLAILLIVILTQISGKLGDRTEILRLRLLVLFSMFVAAIEMVYNLVMGGLMSSSRELIAGISAGDLLLTPTCVYLWFIFCDYKSSRRFFSRGLPFILPTAFLVLLILSNLASPWTGWIFSIDMDGIYHRGPYYPLQVFGCYIYYVLAVGICIFGYLRGSVLERDLSRRLFLYALFPIIGGVLQIINGDFPFTVATVTLSAFFTFISMQGQRISTDAMTSLNNKFRITQYVESRVQGAHHRPFTLYMMDVNRFKMINDTHGHVAGDHALILVAESIKTLADTFDGFAGRYGGDEFVIILDQGRADDPIALEETLNAGIAKNANLAKLPFEVTISVGRTLCDDPTDTIEDVFRRADVQLYERKQARKQLRMD